MKVAWHVVPGKSDRNDPSPRERYDQLRHRGGNFSLRWDRAYLGAVVHVRAVCVKPFIPFYGTARVCSIYQALHARQLS